MSKATKNQLLAKCIKSDEKTSSKKFIKTDYLIKTDKSADNDFNANLKAIPAAVQLKVTNAGYDSHAGADTDFRNENENTQRMITEKQHGWIDSDGKREGKSENLREGR